MVGGTACGCTFTVSDVWPPLSSQNRLCQSNTSRDRLFSIPVSLMSDLCQLPRHGHWRITELFGDEAVERGP